MTSKPKYEDFYEKLGVDMRIGMASFLLILPCGMSYELWKYLHKVKGDCIE